MITYITQCSKLPPYMQFPRFLLDSGLSETAMLLYIVLLDRARVSMGNRDWADESGRVFIIYTIKSLGKKMHRSEMTIKTALSALDEKGLIVRTRQGGSRANRIYVRYPEG